MNELRHLIVMRRACLQGALGRRRTGETDTREKPRTDVPLEKHGGWRHHKLRRTCNNHDFANFESVVGTYEGEEHGHKIDCTVEADPEDKTQRAAQREAVVALRPEVHNGLRRTPCAAYKQRAEADACDLVFAIALVQGTINERDFASYDPGRSQDASGSDELIQTSYAIAEVVAIPLRACLRERLACDGYP